MQSRDASAGPGCAHERGAISGKKDARRRRQVDRVWERGVVTLVQQVDDNRRECVLRHSVDEHGGWSRHCEVRGSALDTPSVRDRGLVP